MSTRKNMPHRKEAKRKSALERRLKDVSKYSSSPDHASKLATAKSDVAGLKKKLGLDKELS